MNPRTRNLLIQGLSVVSFVLMCWVAFRSLEARRDCVSSSFLSFVQVGSDRIANCLYSGRLSLRAPLTADQDRIVRALETLEPMADLIRGRRLGLAVDVVERDPWLFELGQGYVRLGRAWLDDPLQVRRALIMGVLRNEFPDTYGNHFQLEVVTDFLLLAIFERDDWRAPDGRVYSLLRDMRFATTAPSFKQYCRSPFRSLSHRSVCLLAEGDHPANESDGANEQNLPSETEAASELDSAHELAAAGETASASEIDKQSHVWGFRPLLAVSMYRVYSKLSVGEKLAMLEVVRSGRPLPTVRDLDDVSAEGLVSWFRHTLDEHLAALAGPSEPTPEESTEAGLTVPTRVPIEAVPEEVPLPKDIALAARRTLKELEVESPTRWELTLDVTATPAWREILEQMRTRSQFRKDERILVFTPEGARALPSGLPVAWAADEISSQKHVLIACEWPRPEDAVHIRARHQFARKTCAKLNSPFWEN